MSGWSDNALFASLKAIPRIRSYGKISAIEGGCLKISGLGHVGRIGDQISIQTTAARRIGGELIALNEANVSANTYDSLEGISLGNRVELLTSDSIRPHESWIGRVLDSHADPVDGRPLTKGQESVRLKNSPPAALDRKGLGERMETGLAVLNTMLPLARGQRIGIFAGSGVGKSTLLGQLAVGAAVDLVVVALVGERGREVREFVEQTMGHETMAKSIVVAATSDQAPLLKRRAAWTAMAIAEYFRDTGRHVMLVVDSLTRFAEAHREIALAAGEKPSLSAFPPSTANVIAALVERAGPGALGKGDITGVFSILAAGSDMDEPVADIVRGLLDGHIVLDRSIAERGRFPAIDVRRSVSRSIQKVATEHELMVVAWARRILTTHHETDALVKSGLYSSGSDKQIDEAIRAWPRIDAFVERTAEPNVKGSFDGLEAIMTDKSDD